MVYVRLGIIDYKIIFLTFTIYKLQDNLLCLLEEGRPYCFAAVCQPVHQQFQFIFFAEVA